MALGGLPTAGHGCHVRRTRIIPRLRRPSRAAPAGPAGQRRAPAQPPPRGAGHALATVRPELKLAETLAIPAETLAVLRGSGFAVAHFVPRRGIVRGTSVVAGLSDAGINKSLMRDDAGQVVSIELDPTGYPGSLMGAVAVIRQA